jgi:chaperone modulatory protein CbpM
MNSTNTRPLLNGFILEHQTDISLEELSRGCAIETNFILELIREGVIAPEGGSAPDRWRFTSLQVRHASVAWRLQRDLGVNLAGAALALQLLDEVETLRAQIAANSGVEDG